MTPEQINKLAKQAGATHPIDPTYFSEPKILFNPEQLAEFVRLVRESTLEEAAKLCEVNHGTTMRNLDSFQCANSIRSLK